MSTTIKEIKIPDENYSFISDKGEKEDILKNLSKINIFVGENNSGKSRLLRSIVKEKYFKFISNNEDFNKINEKIESLKVNFGNFFSNCQFNIDSKIPDLNPTLSKINKVEFLSNGVEYFKPILELKELLEKLKSNNDQIGNYKKKLSSFSTTTYTISFSGVGEALTETMEKTFNLDKPLEDVVIDYNFKKIYIPILRGLRPLQGNNDDFYEARTKDDYFNPSMNDDKRIIFTGLSAYNTINLYSRLNPQKRRLLEDFKEYLSYNFFDGQKIEITAAVDENGVENVLAVKIGDEHEKPIYDLGDGIQSIIILTLQLFLHKNEDLLIFLEEPEQLLHPGLQRKLIETFLHEKGFENFQFFFTTHSNHFLDITLDFNDISIFTVKKELDNSDSEEKVPSFTIENLSEGDTSALELLGVRNSSVFLSNCTLWVEGITDRHYLRHYLELYAKEHENDSGFEDFKEDYHYSYVEYGGNNITHWSFLDKEEKPINVEKLCGRLFLLADKDQGKDKRHKQLKETLKERYYSLKCREIENLVSPDVLLKIVKDYEGINDDESSDNINEDFKYADYKNNLLGRFIEKKIILDKNKMKRKSYMAKSGTIKDKNGFLDKAKKYIQKWDDLSLEAQEITEKAYSFIKEHNS